VVLREDYHNLLKSQSLMMEKCLRPQVLVLDPNAAHSARKWQHWKRTFESYLRRLTNASDADKLDILVSLLDSTVYEFITESATYAAAMECLQNIFVKPVNEVYARHRLGTCRQHCDESIEEFF